MKIISKGRRLLLFVLAFAMLLTMLPPMQLLVFSSDAPTVPTTDDFKKYIGCDAWFVGYSTPLTNDPETAGNPMSITPFNAYGYENVKLVIEDCYYDATYDALWYKVKAAPGYTLPNEVALKPWVFQDYVLNPWGASLDIAEPKMVSDTVTDSNGDPVLGSDGQPLTVTVSGGLPEGAKLEVSVPQINGETLPNVFDIKIYDKDGKEWQPIDEGRTVTVAIPIDDPEIKYVDVVHFIDYANAIHDSVEYWPVEGLNDELLSLLADAVEACEIEEHVAVEILSEISVEYGFVRIETDSFSVYELVGKEFKVSENAAYIEFDNDLGTSDDPPVYYATPDTVFTLETATLVVNSAYNSTYFTITSGSQYATATDEQKVSSGGITGAFGGKKVRVTVTIDSDTPAGTQIKVNYRTSGIGAKNITGTIIVVRPVSIQFDANLPEGITASPMPANKIYDGTEGTGVVTDGDVAKFTISANEPVASVGTYKFKEWNTSPDGKGTPYAPGAEFTPKQDMTFYAIWDADNYYVDYDLNGGAGNVPAKDIYGKGVEITLPAAPTKANCIFLGWSVTDDGKSARYDAGASYKVSSDVTFHAIWGVELTINVTNGTLTLQQDGEYSATAIENAVYVGTIEKIFEKSGTTYTATVLEGFLQKAVFIYTHSSSDIAAVGSGNNAVSIKKLSATQTQATISAEGITKHTEITFNATEGATYYISFDSMGGSAVASIAVKQNQNFTTLPTPPTKQGYDFQYWVDKNGNKVESISNVTANHTLYAVWKAHTYSVTFNSNGGSTVNNIAGYTVESVNVELPIPTRVGYKFTGWKVTATDGSWVINEIYTGKFSGMYGNVTLTAQWKEQYSYKLQFNANVPAGATGTVNGMPSTLTQGWCDNATMNFTWTEVPTRANYRFLGWSTDPNATSGSTAKSYSMTGVGASEQVVTLYAIWELDDAQYTIEIYVENADSDGYTKLTSLIKTGAIGSTVRFDASEYAQYVTNGFAVSAEKSVLEGTVQADGKLVLSLYIDRERYDLKLVVDKTTTTRTYKYGEAIDQPTDPIKEGHTFAGWDKEIPATMPAEDLVITAQWTVNSYTVTWIVDGNKNIVTYAYGAKIVKPTDPIKNGYAFTGWDGYTDGMKMPANDLEFTAKFEQALTSLTIKVNGCVDPDQAFIFRVTGEDGVNLRVTVTENGSVTIHGMTIGESYTVTMESWPWRYNVTSITASSVNTRGTKTTDSITVELGVNGEVTFNVEVNNNWWLDGNSPRGN